MIHRHWSYVATALVVASLALVATFANGCGGASVQLRSEEMDPSTMPPDVVASYRVFTQRCSKCHSLGRVYDSGITDDEFWVKYVERMRRQPGSGITKGDESVVLHYLFYYSAQKRGEPPKKVVDPLASPPPPESAKSAPGGPNISTHVQMSTMTPAPPASSATPPAGTP
jgi:hypothetical protein